MRCLWSEMRHGTRLGDGRFRSAEAIARIYDSSVQNVVNQLRKMERRGEVEPRTGYGNAHGNAKVWRLRRS